MQINNDIGNEIPYIQECVGWHGPTCTKISRILIFWLLYSLKVVITN